MYYALLPTLHIMTPSSRDSLYPQQPQTSDSALLLAGFRCLSLCCLIFGYSSCSVHAHTHTHTHTHTLLQPPESSQDSPYLSPIFTCKILIFPTLYILPLLSATRLTSLIAQISVALEMAIDYPNFFLSRRTLQSPWQWLRASGLESDCLGWNPGLPLVNCVTLRK